MQYGSIMDSPVGKLLISSDVLFITGIKFLKDNTIPGHRDNETSVITEAKRWLSVYFSGKDPGTIPPVRFTGSDFQTEVWQILCTIPYGKTVTYGDIAKKTAAKRGIAKMSAQAVGGAVGKNKIPIIVPCHRVIGAGGNLTGFTGGLDIKIKLLETEGAMHDGLYVPKHK